MYRKSLSALVFVFFITLPLSAQLHLDISPYLWLDSGEIKTDSYTPTLKELYDWYDRPPFMDISFDMNTGNYHMFMQIDLRSDLKADLDHFTITNLPVPQEGNIYIDPNFPQTGYGEYRSENFNFSIGRRKVDWGPGYYDLGFSDRIPYFDNISFDLKKHIGNNTWKYNFIVTTTDNRGTYNITGTDPELSNKTFSAHKISYTAENLIVSASDYSLIYGRIPDIQELAPFIHFHGLYQRDQNVALGFSIDTLINSKLRIYGEYIVDDFQTSIESGDSNPGAMGVVAGMQYRFGRGIPVISPVDSAFDHVLKNRDFSLNGGTVIRWENIWTSEYLYNRDDPLGKFTNPLYYMWEYHPKTVNTYFGAAYGPDRLIERLSLTRDMAPLKLEGVFEYHLIGGHGIDGAYEAPFDNWMTFGSPVTHQFRFTLNGQWNYSKGKSIFGDLKLDFDNTFRIQGGIGWGMKVF